jgi:hypothetical protein
VSTLIDTRLGLLAVPLEYVVRSQIYAPPAFPWGKYLSLVFDVTTLLLKTTVKKII